MTPSRGAAVLVLAAAALLLAPRRPWPGPDCAFGEATYQEAGESLLHAFEPGPRPASYHMPLASALTACLRGHAHGPVRDAWLDGARAVVPAGAALTAGLAGGAAAALAAAAAAAWAVPDPPCHPQAALAFFVCLSAAALVLWARRPSGARAASLAAATAASLALRSTLLFLGPLAAVWAWRRGRRRSAGALLLAPCLVPALWAAANLALHGRAVPFEMGQSSSNLVVGALGLVGTVEGDVGALAPDVPDALDPRASLAWAARESLAHPRRTLDAFVARLAFAVRTMPWLWAAACAGFLAARRRPEARALALFAAAFTAAHAAMAVQASYFTPLAPLLAALATAPLWRRSARLGPWADRPAALAACAALAVSLGAGIGGASWASGLAARHAALALRRPADSEGALEAALSASPEDAVLRFWRGKRSLVRGDVAGAAGDFSAAAAGGLDRARPLASWAVLLGGGAASFDDARGLSCAERALCAMFSAEAAARGRRPEAAALAAGALEAKRACAVARASGGRALFSDAAALRGLLGDLAALRPGAARLAAPPLLARGLAPGDDAAWRALALGLQDLGDAEGSLEAYGRVGGDAADLLADKAVALALAGRAAEAKALLRAALARDPGRAAAALTLGALLEGEGKAEAAKAVYAKALAASRGPLTDELSRRLGGQRRGP